MQISPEDRPDDQSHPLQNSGGYRSGGKWIALFIALGLLGGLGYYVLSPLDLSPEKQLSEPQAIENNETVETASTPLPEPQKEIPQQASTKTEPAFVLPSLDQSDAEASKQLAHLSSNGKLNQWFYTEHVIRRGVTLIDGMSRGILLNKMHKVPGPKGKFGVVKEGNKLWLDPANYQRYGYLSKMVTSIENDKLVGLFHLFRPLLEEAYGELGYSPKKLDSAIIAALEQVIATPLQTNPIALTQDSVQYKYADPTLEALPPIQKQLLRMGPQNTQLLQKKARLLREALLQQ
ncbi:MAG: DUF3014 domain-containing protein [Porticoccus sp.]|nr:DUF3014 domain-containing protein [Porticoccus sp.]